MLGSPALAMALSHGEWFFAEHLSGGSDETLDGDGGGSGGSGFCGIDFPKGGALGDELVDFSDPGFEVSLVSQLGASGDECVGDFCQREISRRTLGRALFR